MDLELIKRQGITQQLKAVFREPKQEWGPKLTNMD